MIEKIRQYITTYNLLSSSLSLGESRGEATLLVALSGGADSVALLRILIELGYNVEAMHCNFHLRGEESDRDEQFCVSLCEKLNIPLHRVHFDTKEYAQLHHVSIEMAARDLRYSYFRQLKKDLNAESICVAHHKDDQTETVLLNLIRGTGLKGLCGMLPKNGDIVRPLLCITRKEIEDYLSDIGQDYVTDSSNLVDDVKRNILRLNIIPQLKEINPQFTEAITEMAQHIRESLTYTQDGLNLMAERTPMLSKTDLTPLANSLTDNADGHSLKFLLFNALRYTGLTKEQISDIAHTAETGRYWESKTHIVVMDRGKLLVEEKTSQAPKVWKFPEEGYYAIGDKHIRLTLKDVDTNFKIDKSSDVAMLDASKIKWPLILRVTEQGDKFIPFGMKGSRLVSDFLTDKKVNLLDRKRQMILTDSTETPLWLVRWRTDDRYKITADTIKALIVRYIKNEKM